MSEPSNHSFGLQTMALQINDSVGRFELRKKLGQGAQSTVWLAFDPRMEREVALKIMHSTGGANDAAVTHWLQEARSVGKVKHPNIVPVYEADIEDRWPYLVFEYIAGRTLEQIAASRGAFAPQEAVALMMDVLDALVVAHGVGVVHRDLKPSNVLVDAAGRARLLDFGIAARIATPGQQAEAIAAGGTVGYMSPEAAGGLPPSASMDIFAAGVMLAEMLMGARLLNEPDTARALYRVAHEQLMLPEDLGPDVDDRLRAIVQRALARDPAQRFGDAGSFLDALQQWSKPQPVTAPATDANASHNGTLDFLLRRMRLKSDFPALSDSVVRIQSMASSETESVGSVTNEILKDVALTNKLLRLVNSAHYARGGNISTVSRAVTLVGFNGIRNMALSLVLLEHMQDKAHAAQLREEFLRSLMAGTLGAELCAIPREAEEAFIGAMFQNLGRLLVQFYFPEEAREVRARVQSQRDPVSEATAAVGILGLTFEELGLGVARAWGLPLEIQRCMRKPDGTPPTRTPTDARERLRWVALASNEIADVILHAEAADVDAQIAKVARKYAQATGVASPQIQSATMRARMKMVDLALVMEIRVPNGSAAAKLLSVPDTLTSLPLPEADSQLGGLELQATLTSPQLGGMAPEQHRQIADTLAAGIQDITNAMVEDFRLSDVLRMILETMYRALNFDRIIFCMRDAKTEMMTGRFGLGQGVEAHAKLFKLPLKTDTPDLFGVVCVKGADTLISDASEPRIVSRLPDWYKTSLNAPTFLLLPLQIKGAPFGLIYADKTARDSLELDEKELALLRTLRNQVVMAFKQSS